MYLYKIKDLKTRKFYFGFSNESRRSFSPVRNMDPMNQFNSKHIDIVKTLEKIDLNLDAAFLYVDKILKEHETDEKFIEIFPTVEMQSIMRKKKVGGTSSNIKKVVK